MKEGEGRSTHVLEIGEGRKSEDSRRKRERSCTHILESSDGGTSDDTDRR